MSISPISLVTSYAALVNGGYKIKPKVNLNENYSKEKDFKRYHFKENKLTT